MKLQLTSEEENEEISRNNSAKFLFFKKILNFLIRKASNVKTFFIYENQRWWLGKSWVLTNTGNYFIFNQQITRTTILL